MRDFISNLVQNYIDDESQQKYETQFDRDTIDRLKQTNLKQRVSLLNEENQMNVNIINFLINLIR